MQVGRRGGAKMFGSLRHGRIVDWLDVDAVSFKPADRSPPCSFADPSYMERKVAKSPDAAHRSISARSRRDAISFNIHHFRTGCPSVCCLMQRKQILISAALPGIVISCARFQNGGSGGLEGSKDCSKLSVGMAINMYAKVRKPQRGDLPGSRSNLAFELRQAPEGPNMQAERFPDFSKKFLDGVFHAFATYDRSVFARTVRLGGGATLSMTGTNALGTGA